MKTGIISKFTISGFCLLVVFIFLTFSFGSDSSASKTPTIPSLSISFIKNVKIQPEKQHSIFNMNGIVSNEDPEVHSIDISSNEIETSNVREYQPNIFEGSLPIIIAFVVVGLLILVTAFIDPGKYIKKWLKKHHK
ncbi:hypothetical protein [Lentilactobacillus laojiaonis]|uniref:hypothetical protein n=1 Tax=Lentilactobacillus laojiaonis TaxID=2883998 RepID=UPI001D0A3D60|nr:hypothetical protein [Lentilactobacillus laojiaonis]UDM32039.1 hypothetical protein LHL71_05795 [Lentilactobacillus laojiaonis]